MPRSVWGSVRSRLAADLRSPTEKCWRCSGRTARARPPCCAPSPVCPRSTTVTYVINGVPVDEPAANCSSRPSSVRSASCSRTTSSSRISSALDNVAFGLREHGVRRADARVRAARAARRGGSAGLRRGSTECTLGRPGAARRDRTRARDRTETSPPRRAPRRARYPDPRRNPPPTPTDPRSFPRCPHPRHARSRSTRSCSPIAS